MPLNAYKADTLSQTLPISLGGTGATIASEALKALFENQTLGTINQPVYLSAGTITAGSTYAGGTLVNLNGSNMGATAVNIYAATSSGTLGQFLISSGENNAPTWVSNITVPGTLNVTGQTTLNDNVTVDGWIITNELTITGQGSAQTPTAAQHIATKGYVDDAISQGFSANDAMVFKGIISSSSVFTNILNSTTAHYSAGWTYRADQNFTISNSTTAYYVEKGDLLIAIADKNTSTTNGVLTDWTVVEHNIDGGLYKSSNNFSANGILLADGTSGKVKTGSLSTTTATVITGISSTTTSIAKITGNASVTASKITDNTTVTVITSVSQTSSTPVAIGSVENGVLIIGKAVTNVGTITTETATASQINTTEVIATNTSYTTTTVVTNTTASTTDVVATVLIS